jgi:hypothetical protein
MSSYFVLQYRTQGRGGLPQSVNMSTTSEHSSQERRELEENRYELESTRHPQKFVAGYFAGRLTPVQNSSGRTRSRRCEREGGGNLEEGSGRTWKRAAGFRPSSFHCSLWSTLFCKFICSRIKKRREPRVTVVTLKLCGDKKSLYSLYEKYPTCAA